MQLPDIHRSRAVLIGVSDFLHLPPLPSVASNLRGLTTCLGDTDLWGLLESNCIIVAQPTSSGEIIDSVEEAAGEAEDTLFVYYAGHGLVDGWNGELSLTLAGSVQGRAHTATPYEWVRRAIVNSRAGRRILILDCCYSGRALGTMLIPASGECAR